MTPFQFRQKANALMSSVVGLPPMDKPTMESLYYDVALRIAESIDFNELNTSDVQSLVADQSDYNAPANLHKFVDVRILDTSSGDYLEIDCVELSKLDNGRVTTAYAHAGVVRSGVTRGRKILRLGPTPTEAVTDGLMITYKQFPQQLSEIADTDTIIDFPESVVRVIPYEACYMWYAGQGVKANKDVAGWHVHFESEMNRIIKTMSGQQQRDSRKTVNIDFGGITL